MSAEDCNADVLLDDDDNGNDDDDDDVHDGDVDGDILIYGERR